MSMITTDLVSILMAKQMVKSQFEYSEEPEPCSQGEKVLPKPATGSFLVRFFRRLNRRVTDLNPAFYASEYKASKNKFEDC